MIEIYKKIGQTPLQLIDELRRNDPELKDEILSYAGRLDPMAEGKMLILVGKKENQKRKKYLNFDKTYEAQILFGFSTDTFDILGMITKAISNSIVDLDSGKLSSDQLEKVLEKIKKVTEIEYPAYSSKTVQGKPLFEWQNSGQIHKIKIPSRKIKIKKIKLFDTLEISGDGLWEYLQKTISSVNGNFRQKQILTKWQNTLLSFNTDFSRIYFKVAKVKLKVSSGTYIRSLAEMIGRELSIPASLLHLKRTKIHRYFNFF